jgi:hypothetical protein
MCLIFPLSNCYDQSGTVSNYLRIKEKGLLVVEQPEEFFAKYLQCTAPGEII